jgi:hypothetical protein
MFRPSEVPMRDDFSEEDEQEAGGHPDLPWPAAGPPPPEPRGQRTRKGMLLVVTALIAAAAGFLVVTAVHDVSANPASASGSPTSSPQGELPSEGTGNGGGTGQPPIPSTGPGQTLRLEIGGKVTAVSATSITLGAHGQSVTATVTKATTVTGKVASIGGVKVGDLVSAQITGTNGKLTATAIQDPASIP